MKKPASLVALLLSCLLAAIAQAELPPDSTEPMGQKFSSGLQSDSLRVLLVGSGSSHHFPRDFMGTDSETLMAAGGMEVAATLNLEEALKLIKKADVLVFSGNHGQWGSEDWQKALHRHADRGKGMVMLHAATWKHPWKGYNERFIGARTPSHGRGEFEVTVTDGEHAVTEEVPEKFKIVDENYRPEMIEGADVHVCCHNAPDQTDGPIPSVWVVNDPKTRIVCITLGHDDQAHTNPAFKTLLTNAVKWVAAK